MDKLAEKIAELAEKFGPHVIDAARAAVQVEAFSSMARAALSILIGAAIIYCGQRVYKKAANADDWDRGPIYVIGGLILGGGGIAIGVGIWTFIDPWTWTAISNPDLWIAKRVLKL